MSRRVRRAAGLPLLVALLILSGCGAGGFGGGGDREEPKTSISNYVALGDGFAAGPYLGKVTDANCLRTANNYPVQVAKAIGANTVTDVSCTGAGTRALAHKYKAAATKKELPAQIDAVTSDTDLVTLGIGITDRDLINVMFRMCLELPCGPDEVLPKPVQTQLKLYGEDLTSAVRTLQDKAPKAYIVLVGYPQIVATGDSCAKLPKVSAAQLDAATLVLKAVNDTLRSAAQQTGSAYVNVAAISANHSACSDDPWVNGFKSVKGKSKAYHPRAAEQAAVAAAIADQVRSR
ncbi:SGNH/GDSL hydrolase family protein [Nocardioides marmoriginsengisoli]|uniref:SGNH/GDSL hydrolase family protein n=1 Tax=Nocardioides marmoriginsengisoli TaxID=661483 RepID=A0A3N0CT75_9ACTN|nr:SGNH/GDSL hydrolase family protein [Nocardioides marmoriginsengisoli]RNL66133.1 SGNH/GDSL hydrolase family protein [Nocardioides marmoriginsengisoli]